MSGVARTAIVVLARVTDGRRDALLETLAAMEDGAQSPFARVPGTHFARWVFVQALAGPGGGLLESEGSFLLMCADFDTTLAEWTEALCARSGSALDAVMSHCDGFPGASDPPAVADFLARHNAAPGFTVAGYRATVEEALAALSLRERLRALAIRAQAEGLSPGELRHAWFQMVAG